MSQLTLLNPFDDSVSQSQHVFRQILKAMSEPGTVLDLSENILKINDAPIYATVWAIVQSLFDSETSVFVSPELADPSVIQSIQFHTDACVIRNSTEANFAMLALQSFTSLTDFHCGTVIDPHLSTTLILQVDSIAQLDSSSGDKECLTLSGPGIRDQHYLKVSGITPSHIELLQSNHRLYPCGIDVVFCSPTQFCAITRSTTILGEAI